MLAPKVSTAAEIDALTALLPPHCELWVMVETPQAIFNIEALAARAADTPLSCFVMGTNDLAKEMQAQFVPMRAPLMTALSLALMAARMHGLTAIDGVFNDIAGSGLAGECGGATMGFDGKTLIHPNQLAACNRIFGPSEAEIDEARQIVAAQCAGKCRKRRVAGQWQ